MKKTKLIKRKNTKKYNIKTKMKLSKTLQNGGMEKEYNRPEPKSIERKIPEPKPSELKQLSKKQILQLLMKYLREKKKSQGK